MKKIFLLLAGFSLILACKKQDVTPPVTNNTNTSGLCGQMQNLTDVQWWPAEAGSSLPFLIFKANGEYWDGSKSSGQSEKKGTWEKNATCDTIPFTHKGYNWYYVVRSISKDTLGLSLNGDDDIDKYYRK